MVNSQNSFRCQSKTSVASERPYYTHRKVTLPSDLVLIGLFCCQLPPPFVRRERLLVIWAYVVLFAIPCVVLVRKSGSETTRCSIPYPRYKLVPVDPRQKRHSAHNRLRVTSAPVTVLSHVLTHSGNMSFHSLLGPVIHWTKQLPLDF